MLNKLATLLSITAMLLLMVFTTAQPAYADTQNPICWVKTIEGDVMSRDGVVWEHGGLVTIEDNLGFVLTESEIAPDGTFLITYGENMAPAGTPLFLEISYGSVMSGIHYSEFLENSAGDDLSPCIYTVEERTFEPGDGSLPAAVTLSHAGILHASTVLPLLFIANAFFLTGATLFGMSLFPPVTSYNDERGNRY